MKLLIAGVCSMLVIVTASCTENAPPKSEQETLPRAPLAVEQSPQQAPAPKPAAAGAKPVVSTADGGMPIPPKDARYTLFCQSITSPNHVREANQVKGELRKTTSLHDWYVVHGDQESTLYYGFYRSYNDQNDKKESNRAQNERKQINAITTVSGDQPFKLAVFVELASPDPQAPAEWNLMNVKTSEKDVDHFWTVEIAAYIDSPQRKQAAVDAVKEARAQGVPAYYYHGPTASSVLVGVWPRTAVKEQDDDAAQSIDPSQPLLVLPFTLPENAPRDIRTPDGERVKVMAPKIEPLDPTLIEMMKRYPNHYVNGQMLVREVKNPKTGKVKQVDEKSYLIQIPYHPGGMDSNDPAGSTLSNPTRAVPPGIARPAQSPGAGKLKEIGQ